MLKTGDFTFHEDLKDEIDVLFGTEKDMQELSLVRFLPYKVGLATEEKHEWREDTLNPESITLTASGAGADWDTNNDITGLPVPAGTIARLKEGSMLKLGTGEVVRVKSVDTVGNTIDLTKRGHGSTAAAAQGAVAFTAYIIGDAQTDGDDPIDSSYLAPTDAYNFVQILEEVISLSGTVLRSKVSREQERARQKAIKLKYLLSQLNFAMWEGVREKVTNIASMQGIRNRTTLTKNVGGALTVDDVYEALEAQLKAGGHPSALHGSFHTIACVEKLFAAYLSQTGSARNPDLTVNSISILGRKLELHTDKHVLDSELFPIDYSRVRYGTLENPGTPTGAFSTYIVTENGKQLEEQIVGYYTMEQMHPSASVTRMYGIS